MRGAALRGLNWGHRRATGPMDALSARAKAALGVDLAWDIRSLHGFESELDRAVLERYDLVVYDHPFCGLVARDGLFLSLDGHLALADGDFVGASLASYRVGGRIWALPVDAATQTALYRPDLLDEPPPATWDETMALAARERRRGRRLGLAALNPHAFLVLAALAANLGSPLSADAAAPAFDPAVRDEAIRLLAALFAESDPRGLAWNAIDLHEAMGGSDGIAYAPLVYAYLTYAEADRPRPLRFAPFAGPGPVPHAGTVLGGAGIGISAASTNAEAALAVVGLIADGDGQRALVAPHHGQPAHVSAWEDPDADRRMGGAFSAVRATMDTASLRPRHPHFIRFQDEAGAATGAFLAGTIDAGGLAAAIDAAWDRHIRRQAHGTGAATQQQPEETR